MVITGDLIYAVITQETNNTVTAMTDNLGNTYTACNAGSDVGAITGRAYYTIVTVPGLLTSVSATVTASSNNAILLAQAFQGPFSGIDANPANVGSDITSPYVGPSTGTLSQAAELCWWHGRARPDTRLAGGGVAVGFDRADCLCLGHSHTAIVSGAGGDDLRWPRRGRRHPIPASY